MLEWGPCQRDGLGDGPGPGTAAGCGDGGAPGGAGVVVVGEPLVVSVGLVDVGDVGDVVSVVVGVVVVVDVELLRGWLTSVRGTQVKFGSGTNPGGTTSVAGACTGCGAGLYSWYAQYSIANTTSSTIVEVRIRPPNR